jgi:N-acetyl-beta-hexosaminidase
VFDYKIPQDARVLGAQGNVWTEYFTGIDQVFHAAYPRAIALAQNLTDPDISYAEFLAKYDLG